MKTRILGLSLALTLAVSACHGGEFGAKAQTAEAAAMEAPVSVDGGSEAVYIAQLAPGVKYVENMTAVDQLNDYVKAKGFVERWDDSKKRMMVIQFAAFNTEDPRSDRNFLIKREMMVKQAVLQAKSDVIRFINSTMSAMDQIDVPGTDLHAELNAEYESLRQRYAAQQQALAKLLENVDAAEAKALAGVTFGDRVNALMEAAIKRLDDEFDAGNIEAAYKSRYETAKQRYEEASTELAALQKKAESLKGSITSTFESSASVHASMPLMGATVIQQTESWNADSEQYEVAILYCWSAELEKAARAALTGAQPEEDSRTGKQSLTEWLDRQELSVMVGPRQFLDDQGQRHFIGITARPVARDAGIDRNNRTIADMFASQMAVFSLFADIDSFIEARQLAQTKSSGDLDQVSEMAVAESLSSRLTQKFENLKIQGLAPLQRKKARHPITGQEMHVSVYGINPAAAARAMQLERQAALSAIEFNQDQAFKAARSQAIREAVVNAKTDAAAIQAGALFGKAEVESARKQAEGAASNTVSSPAGKTGSASIMGGDVQDDF